MDRGDEMDLGPDGSARVQRACDSCRSRKIRCDRGTPCSNCRASKLNCQTTAPAQKAQKQRVHISNEYERKIDRIEDRLAGIERMLETLTVKLGSLDTQKDHAEQSSQSKSSRVGKSPNSSTDVHSNTPAPFEGETALNAQSEYARELLERAVGSTPSIGQNSEIQAALASLQGMVSKQNQSISTKHETQPFFTKTLADVDATKLERPPWEAVSDAIDSAHIYPTFCFAIVFPFLALYDLKEFFRETFETPGEFSAGRRLLVYGVLYNLFTEFACYHIPGQNTQESRQYARQCRAQMETAMTQLDFLLPASCENILALLVAASYAIELAKPSLCWVLTSNAAGLCQHLGYHRISTMKDDSAEERAAKIHVFWCIYLLDKTLSLRLGRASAIRDWDMSLPFPIADAVSSAFAGAAKGTELQLYWIKVAQIQGETYEQLFSPAAFLKPEAERVRVLTDLVHRMNQAWSHRGAPNFLDFPFLGSSPRDATPKVQIAPRHTEFPSAYEREPSTPLGPTHSLTQDEQSATGTQEKSMGEFQDLLYHADAVGHYSTITLIQRAVNTDGRTFSQDCLESARAALMAHQKCSEQFNVKGNEDIWSSYVHWSVLNAPFTPFIVIFCNTITKCSHPDLCTLSDFVLSLESCRSVSEGAERLYKMCQLFLLVAKLYVEAKSKESFDNERTGASPVTQGFLVAADMEQFDHTGINQIDPYLSALGLVPNSAWPGQEIPPMQPGLEASQGVGGSSAGNQNSLEHWFSGSRYIMGLMEDDLNMPDIPDLNL